MRNTKCLDYEDLAEYLREIIIKNGFYTCIGPSNYYKENYVTIKNLNKLIFNTLLNICLMENIYLKKYLHFEDFIIFIKNE